tara:strand:- start:4746 stop:5279 length:534 start_codon:yes stop_codon:yes gene_type:complete
MSDETVNEQPAENADELASLAAEAEQIEPHTDPETGDQLPAEREQDGMTTEQAVQMALGPLFAVLAPNWGVQPAEIEQLAAAYAPVIDKWFPGDFAMGVEMQAVMITAVIIAPRAAVPRNDAAAARAAERQAEKQRGQDARAEAEQAARNAERQPETGPALDLSAASDESTAVGGEE